MTAEPGSDGRLDLEGTNLGGSDRNEAEDDELDGFVVLWERGEDDAEERAAEEQTFHESGTSDARGVDTPATVDETSSIGGWSEISGSVSSFRSPARVGPSQMSGAMGASGAGSSSSNSLSSAVLLSRNVGDTSQDGSSTLLGSLFSSLSQPLSSAVAAAAPASGMASSMEGQGSGSVPFSWAEIAKIQPKFHNQSGERPMKLLSASVPGGSKSASSSSLDASKSVRETDLGFIGGEADVSLLPSSRKLIVESPAIPVKERASEIKEVLKTEVDESGAIIDPHSDPFANKADLGRDARRVGKKQSRIKRNGGRPTKRRANRRKR